ncbi:hypothetical protein ACN4EK_05330 [Pantanalinema rosaneae CENA516]|uniref:hypothetical protein n=1 Tax=Pantanalinema rosaneae TaxID=1620701 RepID=UPI003D6E3A3C
MPLQLPKLDDRTYKDLVEEALRLIPTYAPDWTNHNPSDPGITIIELFAYLTEMLIYRLDRIPDANRATFLKLILGTDEWRLFRNQTLHKHQLDEKIPKQQISQVEENKLDQWFIQNVLDRSTLDQKIQSAIRELRQSDRAITPDDFEQLALQSDKSEHPNNPKIARVHCIPRHDLETESSLLPPQQQERPNHVSVVVVPESNVSGSDLNQTISTVKKDLDFRRLLTTQIHVVPPRYVAVGIKANLTLLPDAVETNVQGQAISDLQTFLDPLKGGADGKGWPFGRSVYPSELYELLDRLPGVDYVGKINLFRTSNPQEELPEVPLRPEELVEAHISPSDITVIRPGGSFP